MASSPPLVGSSDKAGMFDEERDNKDRYLASGGPLDDTTDASSGDYQSIDPDSGVKRGLTTFHISMLALAGIIGPGLLIGAGGALAIGGPASLLIGFTVVGIIALSIMQSLGELATLYPTGGAFISLADRFVDKAFGVCIGWNYFLVFACVLANEYNVITSIMTFWSDAIPIWGWFLIFWSLFLAFSLCSVGVFGSVEAWLALVKIFGLCAYFIFSIVYTAGGVNGDKVGFRYWSDPGPFNNNGFRGVASVFAFCSTFYSGVESVALMAAETKNPRRAVPMAIRQVFWRIIFVYIFSALFFGMTCPANSQGLINGESRALKSPMTIAIQQAGWEGGVHLINTFIFVTCLSAVNSSIYIGSRTLCYMAKGRMAPRFLGYVDKRGVPVNAVIATNLFGCLSLMNLATGAAAAYAYIVNLSGVSTFLVWGGISFTHLRFRRAWKVQGRTTDQLPFKALWYPYFTYFGLGSTIFLALVQGWTTLSPFNAGNFVDAYILLPLFPLIFFGYKFAFKTKLARASEVDLDYGRRRDFDDGKDDVTELGEDGMPLVKQSLLKRLWRNF